MLAPPSAAATNRHSRRAAGKSAWSPPRYISSSVNWVSITPREPASQAALTALVWVMEVCTQHTKASLVAMAAATGRGGSWPSRCLGSMVITMGLALAAKTALAMLRAMDSLESSATITTFSSGWTLRQVSTTVRAPRAIIIFSISPSSFII